jgi:hypothetical protein
VKYQNLYSKKQLSEAIEHNSYPRWNCGKLVEIMLEKGGWDGPAPQRRRNGSHKSHKKNKGENPLHRIVYFIHQFQHNNATSFAFIHLSTL